MGYLAYNEKTKQLEPKFEWAELINPWGSSQTIWAIIRYLTDKVTLLGNLSQDDSENIARVIEEGGVSAG